MCNISIGESYASSKKRELHQLLFSLKGKRQLLLTSIQIANIFKGFSLYFGTSLDFRLRMYPLQYLLSRTSGFLKHTLEDFTSRYVTVMGCKNMLEAYYVGCDALKAKWQIASVTAEKNK